MLCKFCWIEKDIEFFYKYWWKQKWYRKKCKECMNLYNKEQYKWNTEYYKKYHKQYKKANLKKLTEYAKRYNKTSNAKISKQKWLNKNDEYFSKWREENREYMFEYQKQYYKTLKWKLIKKADWNKRRALKNKTKTENINKKFLEELLELQEYKCNYCKIYLDNNKKMFIHLDHIIPLSKWWTHTKNNLQFLCQKCNLSKWNKIKKEIKCLNRTLDLTSIYE